jgi:AraC-like DNA-binding protein
MTTIIFDKTMANILAEYLNRKYMERLAREGRTYSLRAFSKELGIKERTLARMMDQSVDLKGIRLENMQRISRVFKDDFLKAMGLM